MSYSEIGQQVGISRVAVAARVKALEERGILEGYTAIVNPQRISGAVSCYFELELAPEAFGQAAERPDAEPVQEAGGSPRSTGSPAGTSSMSMRWPSPTRPWKPSSGRRWILCRGCSAAAAASSWPGSRTSRGCGSEKGTHENPGWAGSPAGVFHHDFPYAKRAASTECLIFRLISRGTAWSHGGPRRW